MVPPSLRFVAIHSEPVIHRGSLAPGDDMADRYGPGAEEVIREAMEMPEYALVAKVGSDYLFRVNP